MFAIAILIACVWLFAVLSAGNRVGDAARAQVDAAATPAGKVAAGVGGSCSLILVAAIAFAGAMVLLSIIAPMP